MNGKKFSKYCNRQSKVKLFIIYKEYLNENEIYF